MGWWRQDESSAVSAFMWFNDMSQIILICFHCDIMLLMSIFQNNFFLPFSPAGARYVRKGVKFDKIVGFRRKKKRIEFKIHKFEMNLLRSTHYMNELSTARPMSLAGAEIVTEYFNIMFDTLSAQLRTFGFHQLCNHYRYHHHHLT